MNNPTILRELSDLLSKVSVIAFLSLFIFACAEQLPEQNGDGANAKNNATKSLGADMVATATWDAVESSITMAGVSFSTDGQVNVYDEQGQSKFLGVANVEDDGRWQLEILLSSSEIVPCDVYIETSNTYEKVSVLNAPAECGNSQASVQSREIITASQPPDGSILAPSGSVIEIKKGNSLTFEAGATDPDGDTSFIFIWDFGGYTLRKVGQSVTIKFDKISSVKIQLMVRDSTGSWDASRATVTVNVVNQTGGGLVDTPNGTITKPTSAQNISVGDFVRFEASGADPQNLPLSYSWNFGGSGISNSIQQNPGKMKFDKAGVFNVSMKVSNDTGVADPTPDSVRVTVTKPNTVNAAPDGIIISPSKSGFFITAGDTLLLMGSASGSDDEDLTYTWDVGSYGPQMIGQNVEMKFNNLGPVTLKLFVKNNKNNADLTPATLTFNVVQIVAQTNSAPYSEIVSPISDRTINVGEAVPFSGNALDPDGDMPLHFLWDFDGAIPFSTVQNPGAVIFTKPGVYRVTMRAIDSLGQADQTPDVRIVIVNGTALSPPDTFIDSPAGNVTIQVGGSVNFSGSATDPDQNTPFNYLWNFAGVAPTYTVASPGPITFNSAGVYTISLRAGDSSGAKDPTPATVQVSVTNILSINEPPNSTIITPSLDMEVFVGDSLEFLGTGTDPDGDPLSYSWDFGGAASNSQQINAGQKKFTQPGVFTVTLTATDNRGLSDPTPASVRITVKVAPGNVAPDGVISSPSISMNIDEGDAITFAGYGTDPDGNVPLSYLWNFDGAVPNLITNTPGRVVFSRPGVYRVRLIVKDSSGLRDPTPAERIIVVSSLNRPTGNLAPNAVIMSPSANTVVTIGDALAFAGSGIDSDGNTPLTFRWNFDGVIPNTIAPNPGLVTFTRVGTYRIVLSTTDSLGAADPTPAERLITVVGNSTTNVSPSATISMPRSNQNIGLNGVVNFMGAGSDPNGNTPLIFVWDFDGALPNIVGENPGNVTFKKAGTFVVTLSVIDSLGAMSPPKTVTVVVGSSTDGGTGGGNSGGTNNGNGNWPIITPSSGELTLNVGSSYTFEGSRAGLDGRQSTFSFWNFAGYFSSNSIGTSVTKTFNKPGTITVRYYSKAATGSFASPSTLKVIVQ